MRRTHDTQDVTELLRAWSEGDDGALAAVAERIYRELRAMAGAQLRSERANHTLQPTALVHEAFLRLVDQRDVDWRSRAQFFDVAARMMRRTLVDYARHRRRLKRGGGSRRVTLCDAELPIGDAERRQLDVLALHEALERLARLDPRQSRIVELHLFGGLTVAETAEVMGCSEATVSRDWRTARIWLARELGQGRNRVGGPESRR